jgi:hypothetical protein
MAGNRSDPINGGMELVGARGFEPPTTCTPFRKLHYNYLYLLKSIGAPVAPIAGQRVTPHNRFRKSPASRTRILSWNVFQNYKHFLKESNQRTLGYETAFVANDLLKSSTCWKAPVAHIAQRRATRYLAQQQQDRHRGSAKQLCRQHAISGCRTAQHPPHARAEDQQQK